MTTCPTRHLQSTTIPFLILLTILWMYVSVALLCSYPNIWWYWRAEFRKKCSNLREFEMDVNQHVKPLPIKTLIATSLLTILHLNIWGHLSTSLSFLEISVWRCFLLGNEPAGKCLFSNDSMLFSVKTQYRKHSKGWFRIAESCSMTVYFLFSLDFCLNTGYYDW